VLGIGTGGSGDEFWRGLGKGRPVAVMRDYMTATRRALRAFGATEVLVGLACLGPAMTKLAGEVADVALLNWANPAEIALARQRVAEGAVRVDRDPAACSLTMYIRVCVDDDEAAARQAFGVQVLSYAMGRTGSDKSMAYRGLFTRMGFGDALDELEAARDAGTSMTDLVDAAPDELLQSAGYYGPAAGAPPAFARLSEGLDEALVRIITTRPGLTPVVEAMQALTPAKVLRQGRTGGGVVDAGATGPWRR
jgi:alkanesulfonate monooxygenase SsuD/methylene tetrahydromethanopterin reductase-like flavin-dependent oxidoreductase (luciferase family)